MIGILVEKNSQGRAFAEALGASQVPGSMAWQGAFNGEQFIIAPARGHLYCMKQPEHQVSSDKSEKYKSWELSNLPWNHNDFKWEMEPISGTSDAINNIKRHLSKCDELVIGTDIDPSGEGQMIAWEVFMGLNLQPSKFSRMYFTDEAKASIQKAFKDRKPLPYATEDPEYLKALYRSQWDFLSMQFTRIASKCVGNGMVPRQGRLKSAMVSIVGDMIKANEEYKKVPSYSNRFKDENGVSYVSKDEPEFKTKGEVPNIYTDSAVIVDSVSQKTSPPPKLLDLAGLASNLSSKGILAKTVLDTYQKMYEAKVVSYPRTEDKHITTEQFNELVPLADKIATVVGVDSNLLTHKSPRKTHVKEGIAHGANRPGPNVPNSLSEVESRYGTTGKLIYEMLAKNYLAMLAADYEYETQKGHLEKYPSFVGSTSIPKKMGYKEVFDLGDDDEVEEASQGLGKLAKPFVHEGFPPKPPLPTMKSLMKALEKHDVGTGATRASVYADVTNSRTKHPLLKETKGKLSMHPCGSVSYVLLQNTNIGSLDVTSQMLKNMKDISKGLANGTALLSEVAQFVAHDIEVMKENTKHLKGLKGLKPMKERYEGLFNGQEISFSKEYAGRVMTDEECEKLLNGEEIELDNCVSANGTYGVTGVLKEQEYKGKKFVGFFRTGFVKADDGIERFDVTFNGESKQIKREYAGHTFTDSQVKSLQNGETILLENMRSKAGKTYSMSVKIGENTYEGKTFVGIIIDDTAEVPGMVSGVFKGKDVKFKKEFRGYTVTDDEITKLLNGEEIEINGLKSSKGTDYDVLAKLDNYDYNGKSYFGITQSGFPFPKSFCQHVFTDVEKEALISGNSVHLEGCISKAKKVFSCDIVYSDKGTGSKTINFVEKK